MKKLLALCFALAAGIAQADSVIIGVAPGTNNNNTTDVDSTTYIVKGIFDLTPKKDVFVDAMISPTRNSSTLAITNQYEVGAGYRFLNSSPVTPYVRLAAGAIEVSKVATMTYGGVEVGAVARVPGTKFWVKPDYTVATGINTSALDIRMTRLAVGYDITARDTIGLRQDWIRGDMDTNTAWLLYSRKF
jgi:hypothetical protein